MVQCKSNGAARRWAPSALPDRLRHHAGNSQGGHGGLCGVPTLKRGPVDKSAFLRRSLSINIGADSCTTSREQHGSRLLVRSPSMAQAATALVAVLYAPSDVGVKDGRRRAGLTLGTTDGVWRRSGTSWRPWRPIGVFYDPRFRRLRRLPSLFEKAALECPPRPGSSTTWPRAADRAQCRIEGLRTSRWRPGLRDLREAGAAAWRGRRASTEAALSQSYCRGHGGTARCRRCQLVRQVPTPSTRPRPARRGQRRRSRHLVALALGARGRGWSLARVFATSPMPAPKNGAAHASFDACRARRTSLGRAE